MTHQSGPLRGRPCSVCKHQQEREIATALLAGGSCREVAKRYRIALSTLARHNRLHLKTRIARAESAFRELPAPRCEPGSIEAQVIAAPRLEGAEAYEMVVDVKRAVQNLFGRTWDLLERAEASGDSSTMLRAIKETRNNLELLARSTLGQSFSLQIRVHRLANRCYALENRQVRAPANRLVHSARRIEL